MISSTRQQVIMKSKNDVAVVVLAHAKARIGLFFRLMCDCLPTRLSGASIRLMMTDTDSIACSIHVPMLMRRNIDSGKLMFRSNSERDVILSNMDSDKVKAHVELILSGSPEMRRIIDRAHFEEHNVYFNDSRKKVVGLYSDEVPLPKMIITFQCAGPKNYQLKKIHIGGKKDGKITSKVKHKGIPQKVRVEESDYSRLLLLWDKQYDINRVAKKYDIEERRTIFNTTNKGDEVFKKKIDKIETEKIIPKTFESRSFYTTAAGVFMTKTSKRLGVTPSDKVLFPRTHFGSYSVGSRFSNSIFELNSKVSYDELFSDKHLEKLNQFENETIENLEKFYPNGVRANKLINLEEEIDYCANVRYLERQDQKAKKENQTNK